MINRIRQWWKAQQARKWANWLRDNKVVLPTRPSWDRAAEYYARQREQSMDYLARHPHEKPF